MLQIFHNDVDDSHPNKQYWIEELRVNVLRCFDVSIPNWKDQPKAAMQTVWRIMDADWEYTNGDILSKKFGSHCRAIMKRERHKLHNHWKNVCKCDRSKPGPQNLDPQKWARLVDHFSSPAMLAKSAEMSARREKVIDTSNFGRGGVIAAEKRHVRPCICMLNILLS